MRRRSIADQLTRQVVGIDAVCAAVRPRSELGRELASSPRSYSSEDRDDWRAEHQLLQQVETWWSTARASRCAVSFEQLPLLQRPLLLLESGDVLDEVALFELKRFLFHAKKLVDEASPHLEPVPTQWSSTLGAMAHAIHPERVPSARFSLSSQLDERLAAARRALKTARRAHKTLREEMESSIVDEHGGAFDVHGRLVPSTEVIDDERLRPIAGDRYEIASAQLDELAADVTAAQMECARAENVVRSNLSDAVRRELETLMTIREALGRLDVRCALVELRRRWDGCWAAWGEDATVIEHGRHPRLEQLMDAGQIQPISLTLDERPVVVTGPNMGGKSLLLELVGLCQWCAQHAWPIPAQRFDFTPVAQISYIGSEGQADTPGLSSFGREVRRVVEHQRVAGPTLWLLDEFARGTHPDEGAEIAGEFITNCAAAGDRVVAATHFPQVARLEGAQHLRIAGLTRPGALAGLQNDPQLADIESALRAAMDYRPLAREASDDAVPRDARAVARALGLTLDED